MSKPEWLKEIEKNRYLRLCCDCDHYGQCIGYTKHHGKEKTEVHRCALHPKVLNTAFSYSCEDWSHTPKV